MVASRRWFLSVAVALTVSLTLSQQAMSAVSLSDLISTNGSMLVGGSLLFDQFSYAKTGLYPSASRVSVVPQENTSTGTYGIRFVGGFTSLPDVESKMIVNYRVSTVVPGQGISWSQLSGNPAVFGAGANGFISISETVAGMPSFLLNIYDVKPGSTNLLASGSLPVLQPSINVAVDMVSDITTGGGSTSFIDSNFRTAPVPEPASIVVWVGTMMIAGVFAFGGRFRNNWSQALTTVKSRVIRS